VSNNRGGGTGESCVPRRQQGTPRIHKIAGGRVKLRRGQTINNEVACAKL